MVALSTQVVVVLASCSVYLKVWIQVMMLLLCCIKKLNQNDLHVHGNMNWRAYDEKGLKQCLAHRRTSINICRMNE